MSIGAAIAAIATPFRALGNPEGRRGWALMLLAGGGMAMTVMAGFALWLVREVPSYAFQLGLGALVLVGIVLTGFAGLLIKRTIRGKVGGSEISIEDARGEPE
ncbi:hypothetical protein ACFQ1E_17235 [Sphingomonas canadensis]|uniref:Major facilitator superfamily (MFS) profile domain-containing protein n=1 Tax=Sphingomonas canadensis TaxID=1219257 RepID=A0ABW3HCF5_9SPHN|nr:hypothetical protein [Sphingomonas canadensis]MCW3837791.1 hypothetical protein [Sphingomonas canadensis]